MLTALDHAINRIKLNIPKEILEKTFIQSENRFRSFRSAQGVDGLIRQKVIREIVMTDCNLIGANEVKIPVKSSWCETIDSNHIIVRVPKAHSQNRTITEVLNATYLPQSGYLMPYGTIQAVSDMTLATNKLLNTIRNPTISGTADTEIVGENVIAVIGAGTIPNNLFLTVMVEYDENMSSLNRSAYHVFAELCLKATKAYIWTNRIVLMDKAEIEGGYQLNRYTSIIEGYEDAYEQYTEYFNEKWKKISFMADPKRMGKYRSMITRVGL